MAYCLCITPKTEHGVHKISQLCLLIPQANTLHHYLLYEEKEEY